VQLLRIYAFESKPGESYSWADHGEFTVWASYINAIKKAEKYIYIEDQYLYPFGFKPYFERSGGTGRDSDIFYQLGEAIKRGVDVICLVPGRNDAILKHYEFQGRRRGADYLRRISEEYPGAGRFMLSKLQAGKKDPVIHSKVMLVDDELALVGSANVAQRSMCMCSEIHMAIIDEKNELARDLRLALWGEHMELEDTTSIMDPRQAVTAYIENAEKGAGRLKSLPMTRMKVELPYGPIWDKLIDPYRGPERS
jgi:phosphatidylserine/phosphatidylglycerophosphate/cardiolipin synthase-like enzyme